jgi:hypothetical protein
MKKEAELYLKENYKADWSPKSRVEIQAPSSTTTPGSTSIPSSLSSAPTNGKKKKVPIHFTIFYLACYIIF